MDPASSANSGESEIVRRLQAIVDHPSSGDSIESAASDFAQCAEALQYVWSQSAASTPSESFDSSRGAGSVDGDGSRGLLPRNLGRFEIRRILGHGGFGVVLLAYDSTLAREVALKIPRPDLLLVGQTPEQFLREAQAAAVLDHAGIVPVFDAGELGTIWYIAAGYVKGPSLAVWLREHALLAPKLAAIVIAALAEAVGHAHSRGILHRDLKPSNVLLEPSVSDTANDFPFVPKLTDFGLSKRLETVEDQTLSGMLIGTPRYMAPEQAAGRYKEVGVTTDVYGLGAILHELLTGEPPFVGESNSEVIQRIQSDELSLAGLRARRVPKDLETICAKCLEKDQSRRYQTAVGLADDLRRFVAGEPVTARPIGSLARLGRWSRRRPVLAGLSLALAWVSVLGIAGITWQWRRAERHLAEAIRQGQRAQDSLQQARRAVDDSFTILSEQRLLNEPGMQPLRRELLTTALKYYQDFARDHANDPSLQGELAHACIRAAGIHATIGEHAEAERQFRRAIELREALVRQDPTSIDRRGDLADAYKHFAIWQNINRRGVETESLFQQAIRIRQKLAQEQPLVASHLNDLAVSYQGLADLYNVRRGWAAAEEPLQKAVEIRERLVVEHPTVVEYQNDLALSYHTLAVSRRDSRRLVEAVQFFRKAIEIREKLARDRPSADFQRELAQSYKMLALVQSDRGQRSQAAELFDKALAIHEKLARENPAVVRHKRDLAAAHVDLAKLHFAAGRYAEAEASCRKGIALQEQVVGVDPSVAGYQFQLANYYANLTHLLNRDGRMEEACQWHRKACQTWEIIVRLEPENRKYWFHLAVSYLWGAANSASGDREGEAQAFYDRAIQLFERFVREDPNDVGSKGQLVEAYEGQAMMLAKARPAGELVQSCRAKVGELAGTSHDASPQQTFVLAALHARLAFQLALAGNDKDALDREVAQAVALAPGDLAIQLLCFDALGLNGAWRQAADLLLRTAETGSRNWGVMARRARVLFAAGDLAAYRTACAQLMEIRGPTADVFKGCVIAGICLLDERALDDMSAVVELAERCVKAEPNNPMALSVLGSALYRTGQIERAAEILEKALPLYEDLIRPAVDLHDSFRLSRLSTEKFLMLSYRDLGKTDKVAATLAEIQRQLTEMEQLDLPSSALSTLPWSFRLAVNLTRRELADLPASEKPAPE